MSVVWCGVVWCGVCVKQIFLWNLGLDKPFTGGIGSFKLYVMVAYIISRAPNKSVETSPGFILLSFLKHFGSRANLNRSTVVRFKQAEVSFVSSTQVGEWVG